MSSTKTLTVAQLLILTIAAQRPDHMVHPLPPTIRARGGAQRNLLGALLKMGFVEEVPINDATIAWRTDETGQHHGLRITAAGLAAAGAPSEAAAESVGADVGNAELSGSEGSDADAVEEPAPERGSAPFAWCAIPHAAEPGLSRRGPPQGQRLSRRARGHH